MKKIAKHMGLLICLTLVAVSCSKDNDPTDDNLFVGTYNGSETLPWGAVLMPFLHGLRALTDYLNGDVYYKVAYKNQNLDRSLSLLNFTEKALAHFAFMSDTINATIVPKN